MLELLKKEVCEANKELVKQNLVIYTWGNVSAYDSDTKMMVIKPSGVSYEEMQPEDMVVVDLDGNVIEGNLKPSSDTKTHLEIYKHFDNVYSVVHTHSKYATAWAQAGRDIPAYGTTHADYFYGKVPCARNLTEEEINGDYETNTGRTIVETFKDLDPVAVPGVLCHSHGPFAWGKDTKQAVHNAKVLEELAEMAYYTENINPQVSPLNNALLDKHYLRKHGKDAYYGQEK